jgi:formate dehydrogenase gamma subunit
LSQRWEHIILLISFTVLFLTGIVQKYRATGWSQQILSTPERLELIQSIHHIAAIVLIAEAIYHVGLAIVLMIRKKLTGDMLISLQDIKDAIHMLAYLVFIRKEPPKFGRYSFEQKVTYWFIFFAVGIMIVSGIILWFPVFVTRFFPGGIIPAAKLAHSTEAIVAGIFLVIWHFFHVHFQRLNLTIFTGTISENEMAKYHTLEYQQHLMDEKINTGDQE